MVDVSGGSLRAGREATRPPTPRPPERAGADGRFTLTRGAHTFTFGTHNESSSSSENVFVRENFWDAPVQRAWTTSPAASLAQSYDSGFSLTGDRQQAAKFSVQQFGFTLVTCGASTRATVNYGVSWTTQPLPGHSRPPTPRPSATFSYRDRRGPAPKMWSPRAGFNWDVQGTRASHAARRTRPVLGPHALRCGCQPVREHRHRGFRRIGATFNAANRDPVRGRPAGPAGHTIHGRECRRSFSSEIDMIDPDYEDARS